MDAAALTAALNRLLYSDPLVLAGAVVLVGILLLLVGRRLGRRRADPLLPDTGEPGAPRAEDVPLRIPELSSPEMAGFLSTIEVPPAPSPRDSASLQPPEQTPRPGGPREAGPAPEAPRWRLRAEEVRSHTFQRRLRGYDRREVYEYLVAVSDELAALQRRVMEFRQESKALQAELGRWREQAGKVQNTLGTAQRLAEEMIANAQEEAAREADRIVQDALERLIRLQQEISRLEGDRGRIREEMRRDALTFAAALRDLEADSVLPARGPAPRPLGGAAQEGPGP
ncbi:MAG: DivIVA domain-containing protein [candidate division NC10 bacterium]|nr:DivIVA domain-containing protein [candidate division NC10 bacterium]